MSQLVKISFHDSQNWINSKNETINWDNLTEFYKDEEPAPHYLPPQIFEDTWNGKARDVQHIRHDTYQLEFIGKSSELIELSRMQSCDTILIHDINSGMPIQSVDMQKSEWLNFGEPERIADTSSWRLILIYRTNKTVINKFDGLDNVVTVVGGSGTYNSKYEKIPFIGPIEQIKVPWDEGGEKILREINKIGSQVLFYMNKTNMDALKNDWNQNEFTIDGTDVLEVEKLPLEITPLGEDNYKIVLSGITAKETDNKWTGATADTLEINLNPYPTPFNKLSLNLEVEQITVPWPDGSIRLLREINRKGFKFFYYYSQALFETFKNDYNEDNALVVLPATNVIEKLELEASEDEYGWFQVIASVVTTVTETTYDLTPLNTHELVITDTGGPYTFHTDYATEADTPDAEKEPISNEDGLLVDPKIISRQVTDIKFYLNTADKNSLKFHYEKATAATIDTVAILYRGIVETNELAKDLWEVDIVGLTTIPLVTNPL